MTTEKSEEEIAAEIAELESLLARWRGTRDTQAALGRRLVRQVITRRRARLRRLRKTVAPEEV